MITKEQFKERLAIITSLAADAVAKLDASTLSMEALFVIVSQTEQQCLELRELASQHSRELAKYTDGAGLKLDGTPDRRWKAAKKYY